MSSCRTRACRWPAPRGPWAFVPERWAWAMEPPESQAGFPPRGGRSPRAHPTAAWRAIAVAGAGQSAVAAAAALAGGRAGVRGLAARLVLAARLGLVALPTASQGSRRDRRGRAEPADSMGLPRPFCLWILKYSDHVWNVFSCCFQPLPIILPSPRNTIPGAGAANLVHSVTYCSAAGSPFLW